MNDLNVALLISGILTIIYQLSFFTIASYFKFDKVTDLAGGTNFAVVALLIFGLFAGSDAEARQITITTLVVVWALRLSSFLFYRVVIFEKDGRFDGTREVFCEFLKFWIFQMFWVFVVSLPVIYVNTTDRNSALNAGDYIGIILASIGFICETWADQSKLYFKIDKTTKGKWCDWGLWKFSRHPNYFGELAFWWGIFIIGAQACDPHTGAGYYIVLSPLFITCLLFGLSGMPILERQANERFGKSADYLRYRQETSPLIPLPNCLYRSLPLLVKRVFFFEFSIYEKGLEADTTRLAALNPSAEQQA